MRRRHLRGVLRIEQQVYPRPWSMGLFMSELGYRGSRVYVMARIGATVVGYGGLMLVADDGHITTLAVDPRVAPPPDRHPAAAHAGHRRHASGAPRTSPSRCGSATQPAQRLYRAFGFAPAGVRKGYYAETNEDALIMWANDVDTPDYASRLATARGGSAADPPMVERLDP